MFRLRNHKVVRLGVIDATGCFEEQRYVDSRLPSEKVARLGYVFSMVGRIGAYWQSHLGRVCSHACQDTLLVRANNLDQQGPRSLCLAKITDKLCLTDGGHT